MLDGPRKLPCRRCRVQCTRIRAMIQMEMETQEIQLREMSNEGAVVRFPIDWHVLNGLNGYFGSHFGELTRSANRLSVTDATRVAASSTI